MSGNFGSCWSRIVKGFESLVGSFRFCFLEREFVEFFRVLYGRLIVFEDVLGYGYFFRRLLWGVVGGIREDR